MRIEGCFSFLHRVGGSAGTHVCRPKAWARTSDRMLNCSLSPSSSSAAGLGAGLSSGLPFLPSSGLRAAPSG